jgi:transposase
LSGARPRSTILTESRSQGAIALAQQFQVEIPRKPIHRQFNIHVGRCRRCHRRVQGRHPLQTSDALGAAAAQLGPDAQAAVVELNKQGGLSHGKVVRCLGSLFGIDLSRGGGVHTILRAANRCEPIYEAIRQNVGQSDWAVPDETGWRVGGYPAWLHTLVGPEATAYVIDPTRSGAVAEDILGLDYDGTMIHDGQSPYDQFQDARHQQCLNHLLRRAEEMEANATRGAVIFPRRVAELLWAGLDLRDRHAAGEISRHVLVVARGQLESRQSDLIFPPKMNAANERLAQHLWAHRDELFTFLRQPGLDATNWRAELAIRFGVILRKVWGGSRTWAGARAQAVLMSVWRTCWQQARNALDTLSQLLRGQPVVLARPP